MLEVDAMLNHHLDFPVCKFRYTLIVEAEIGFKLIKWGRGVPAFAAVVVAPEVADVKPDVVVFGFGNLRV